MKENIEENKNEFTEDSVKVSESNDGKNEEQNGSDEEI